MKIKKLLKLIKRECNEKACNGSCPFLAKNSTSGCMIDMPEFWDIDLFTKILKRLKKKK